MTVGKRWALAPLDRPVLEFLLGEVQDSYARSKVDRARLHGREWESEEDSASVLGEAEIRADFVVGIVRTWLAIGVDGSERDGLVEQSVHRSPTLHGWLATDAAVYPQFAAHVQAVEHLRAAALRVLAATEPDSATAR